MIYYSRLKAELFCPGADLTPVFPTYLSNNAFKHGFSKTQENIAERNNRKESISLNCVIIYTNKDEGRREITFEILFSSFFELEYTF